MQASDGNEWYVAQTQPRKESVATQNLENQGFRAYCPRVRRTRRHARKFTTVSEPLFPGYVFVGIDVAEQPWRSVNGTLGVSRILTDGARPVPLEDGLVEHLMSLTGAAAGHGVQVGQDVRLRTGPFADFVGSIVDMPAGNRVRILLRLMNREITIGAHMSDLDLLGHPV
ncbi:transcriptional activator RfaH [Emcibacter sp. SYSU 3D8]|uniref:transcription termination/antitermination protein NusG n=1 Tax=Emcibacter sp. SYSU 3D8 TaxID=3133969 RepID=UPI0031FE8BD1